MDNANQPAFPVPASTVTREGLTKREYLAAMIDPQETIDAYTLDFWEKLIGRKSPVSGGTVIASPLERLQFWAEVEAKVRIIKADALLAELVK